MTTAERRSAACILLLKCTILIDTRVFAAFKKFSVDLVCVMASSGLDDWIETFTWVTCLQKNGSLSISRTFGHMNMCFLRDNIFPNSQKSSQYSQEQNPANIWRHPAYRNNTDIILSVKSPLVTSLFPLASINAHFFEPFFSLNFLLPPFHTCFPFYFSHSPSFPLTLNSPPPTLNVYYPLAGLTGFIFIHRTDCWSSSACRLQQLFDVSCSCLGENWCV